MLESLAVPPQITAFRRQISHKKAQFSHIAMPSHYRRHRLRPSFGAGPALKPLSPSYITRPVLRMPASVPPHSRFFLRCKTKLDSGTALSFNPKLLSALRLGRGSFGLLPVEVEPECPHTALSIAVPSWRLKLPRLRSALREPGEIIPGARRHVCGV